MVKNEKNLDIYLKPTFFIDYDSEIIKDFAEEVCRNLKTDKEKAIRLFYEVRDRVLYNPYQMDISREGMKASFALKRGHAFCIPKAALLAAAARYIKIPARLGFADVKNHLTTKKLKRLFGTDLFVFHGYTELFLDGRWIKATPAFNLSLCDNFKVKPLDFDGEHDAVFHEFSSDGKKHMEYVNDRGVFDDVPYDDIINTIIEYYPDLFSGFSINISGSFEKDS